MSKENFYREGDDFFQNDVEQRFSTDGSRPKLGCVWSADGKRKITEMSGKFKGNTARQGKVGELIEKILNSEKSGGTE